MLYFQSRPDPIFSIVVKESLEFALDTIKTSGDDWRVQYERSGSCMSTTLARREIRRLLDRHTDPSAVFQVSDYHWLLIFESLLAYCEILNDQASENPDGRLSVGGHRFSQLDFDTMVEVYFWDTDFLWTAEDLPPREARELAGCSEQIFAIAHSLTPHHEELEIERIDDATWHDETLGDHFHPESDRYPASWVD